MFLSSLTNFIEKTSLKLVDWIENRFDLALVLLVLLAGSLTLVSRIYRIYLPIADIGGIETNVIYAIQRMMAGLDLYNDPSHPPYSITQYSPLYFMITSSIGNLLGLEPKEVFSVYKLSRICSIVFNLFFVGIIYLLGRKQLGLSKYLGIFAAVATFILLDNPAFSRPDSLFNFLLVLCLYGLLWYSREQTSKRHKVYISIALGVFTAVTILTKQSGIILIPLIPFIMIVLCYDWKRPLIFLLSWGLAMAVGFWGISSIGGYDNFIQNAIQGVNNGLDFGWFWQRIVLPYFFGLKGALMTSLCLFVAANLWRKQDRKSRILSYSILIIFVFTLGTCIKKGSSEHYFTELWALSLVGLGMIANLRLSKSLLFLCFLFLFGSELAYSGITGIVQGAPNMKIDFSLYESEKEVVDFVLNNIEDDGKGEVNIYIADQQSTFAKHSFMQNFAFRYALFPNRDIVDCCSAPLKIYDYSSFAEMIKQKNINYVIAPLAQGTDLQYLDQSLGQLEQIKVINDWAIYKNPAPTIPNQ
ncbi:MAG: hypothetical protein AAF927_01960 [Bacteroidota bacterium]